MLSEKAMIIQLIIGLIKNAMSEYFPKIYKHFGGNVRVELDLNMQQRLI